MTNGTEPATPDTGRTAFWVDETTKALYTKDDSGTVSSANDDKKAKVSSNDTTPAFLASKIVAGSNITITETNDGADETLVIASTASGSGDVVGPASSVNNNVVMFDGTTGKLIKDSGVSLSGSNTGDQTDVTGNSGSTNALKSATTTVNVSSATAPTTGQVLTATSSTAATWQTPASGGGSSILDLPSSAPDSSSWDNGSYQAYANEAANTLNFLVKYSNGTLKRGIVDLIAYSVWASSHYYTLDGVDERFEGPTARKLQIDGAAAYTVSLTLNFDMTRTKTSTLFSFFDGTATGKFEGTWLNSQIRFQVGANYSYTSPTRAAKDYHIVMVFDGSQATDATRAKIYIDGSLATVFAAGAIPTAIPSTIAPFILGVGSRTATPANFIDEDIKEISFYNTALSSTDVSTLYNSGSYSDPRAISGCVASWWFGDNPDDSELEVKDNVGSNHLTCINIEAADIM